MIQLTAYVSLSGLPVLTTLYKQTPLHKRTNSQNCECCVSKSCSLKKTVFYIFFTFGPFNQKSGIIVQKLK